MNRRRNLLGAENLPKIFSRIIIFCLVIYILIHTQSFFKLPDIKNLLKSSGEKVTHTIASDTITYYHPIVGYVMNDEEDNKRKGGWENQILQLTSSFLPIYQYVDEQYVVALDKSDPNYINHLVTFYSGGSQTTDSDNSQANTDTAQANTNVTIPMPELTGTQYTVDQLSNFDFLMNNFYTFSDSTVVYNTDLDASKLMTKDLKMAQDNSKPQILIYHTHSQEYFTDTVEGDPSTTIVGVGTYLAEILSKQFGYNVIHDTTSYDLVNGVLDRSKAYDYSGQAVAQILADNPSIEVVLDIHRDGVNEHTHLVTEINGKPTAKIMFFNGISRLKDIGNIDYLYNPNLETNLAMSMQMKMLATAYYPDFTRKNFIKPYEYNLKLRPKAMLIEVGAQTNSLQEEKNAMEPLSVLLNKLLQ